MKLLPMLPSNISPAPFAPSRAAAVRRRFLSPALICLCWAALAPAAIAASTTGTSAIVPSEPISLFNGEDLAAFYTWIPETGRSDPDGVFTVVDQIDGAPAIRISGQHWGGLVTRDDYANYKLVAEFRWGPITWNPRKDKARDSGILLHGQGEDGNAKPTFRSPWLRSVEYQIIEGGTGDIILIGGYQPGEGEIVATPLTVPVRPGSRIWSPTGTPTRFEGGRINWEHRDLSWQDVLGFRGSRDVERPVGEWNLIEVICDGDKFEYFLNGVKVNEGRNSSLTSGRLLFQSEGAELFFRRIELQPLPR